MSRPLYPWNDASFAARYPAISLAKRQGRFTLEPSEWELTEVELEEVVIWSRECLKWIGYVQHSGVYAPDETDWRELQSDYTKIYSAANTALFELGGCDWARVQRSPLEHAAAVDGQTLIRDY